MFWVILIIAILVLGSISWIFDVGLLGALGIVVFTAIAFALIVGFIDKMSSKHPKFGSFLSRSGKKVSAIMFLGGLATTVIGLLIDAGTEVRSYTNYSGGTTSYVADAISILFPIGILVALVGAVMFVSCFLINKDSSKSESNKEKDIKK